MVSIKSKNNYEAIASRFPTHSPIEHQRCSIPLLHAFIMLHVIISTYIKFES